ncbi:MAG: PEP-CTERM sorting domain-containing protein, partial [Akkermansia sp.]|nr:PEP-CTERM sorting domain-containing protein [Akkermansia sp.]
DFTVSGAQYDTTGDAVADADATDGYLVSAGSTSFSVVSGGTINKDGITSVTYNGETVSTDSLSIADNKLTLTTQVAITPTKDYYVNTTVDYAAESVVASDATTGIILNGGTLNLNTALNSAATKGIVAAQDSTINIAADTTLNNSSVSSDGGTATIAGGSTAKYSMGVASMNGENNSANNETKRNVAIGEGWEGTVVFEEGSSFKDYNFNLNDYGVAGSTIQFNGTATGSYLGEASATYVADIELKGDGFSIENGFGGRTYTFTGAFKGDGTFNMNKAGLNDGLDFIFSGNMSKWTGELKQSDAANDSYSYTFNEKATNIANKVTAAAGTMVVNVDNSEAVTMTGDVTATGGTMKLSKLGDSKLTVNKLSANGGNVVLAGTGANAIEVGAMSIAAGNTVTGAADVTVTNTLTINSSNAISLDGALVLTGATVDLSGFTVDTTTAQDTYVYTLGTAAGGINPDDPDASIRFTGLNVDDDYTATLAAMAADPTTSTVMLLDGAATNNYLVLTLTKVTDPGTLTSLNVAGATSYADGVLTLTTDVNDVSAVVFGDKLAASMTDAVWNEIVGEYDLDALIGVSFTDANGQVFDFDGANNDGTAPIVTINGEGTTGAQVLMGDGTVVGNYTTAYIPEPTTTTLSLLALAALAVRRRRK